MTQALPGAHNYHDWVLSSFAGFLRRGAALEVGSGHGQYARRLLRLPDERIEQLLVSDIDPAAVAAVRAELAAEDPTGARVRYLVMDGIDPGLLGDPLDNILLINVLEHVADDAGLLRAAAQVLRPGGALVIFAPAFQRLYSRMDREAGHHRRYEIEPLCRLVSAAGLHVTHARFFNAVGYFGWLANKHLQSGVHSAAANAQVRIYDRLVPLVRRADGLLPFLGQSVVVIATRGWEGGACSR